MSQSYIYLTGTWIFLDLDSVIQQCIFAVSVSILSQF